MNLPGKRYPCDWILSVCAVTWVSGKGTRVPYLYCTGCYICTLHYMYASHSMNTHLQAHQQNHPNNWQHGRSVTQTAKTLSVSLSHKQQSEATRKLYHSKIKTSRLTSHIYIHVENCIHLSFINQLSVHLHNLINYYSYHLYDLSFVYIYIIYMISHVKLAHKCSHHYQYHTHNQAIWLSNSFHIHTQFVTENLRWTFWY